MTAINSHHHGNHSPNKVSFILFLQEDGLNWCSSKCHDRLAMRNFPSHKLLFLFFFPQCCDLGYHASLARTLRTYLSAEYNLETSRHEGLDIIENAVDNLDPRSDKHKIMDMYNQVFCPPMRFEFLPHMGDEVSSL